MPRLPSALAIDSAIMQRADIDYPSGCASESARQYQLCQSSALQAIFAAAQTHGLGMPEEVPADVTDPRQIAADTVGYITVKDALAKHEVHTCQLTLRLA